MDEKVKKQLIALIQAAQNGDEKAIAAIQQIKQLADQGDQQAAALMDAMNAIAQQMQTPTQKVAARLGAKLNYIRTIKGDCPEGQQLVYFKQGGRVCKKCVEAAGGAKVKDGKKEIVEFKKKKACGGIKAKFESGGKPQKPIVNKDDTLHVNGKPYSITYSDGTKKNPKSPYPKYSNTQYLKDRGTKSDKEAQRRVKKVDRVTKDEEMKCGGKTKKHFFGGILGF